jgi:hypothetical protein
MSAHKGVTVRFTATFLRSSEGVLTEGDLRVIAETLANDPYCGEESAEIPELRSVSWPQSEENSAYWNVWYLAFPDVPHIEVVALTARDDGTGDSFNTLKAIWKVVRIGMLLRALYKAYEAIRDHWL